MKQKAICFSELTRHCEAVVEIDDEYILKLIAESGGHNAVRWTAINKIDDEEFLKEFFNKKIESTYGYSQNIIDDELRWKCLKKITDQKFLKEVALDTTESGITRGVAIQRIDISEQQLFEDLYNKDCDPTVQFYAIRKLKNKHLLHYIAACEEDTELQAAGKKRLKELEIEKTAFIAVSRLIRKHITHGSGWDCFNKSFIIDGFSFKMRVHNNGFDEIIFERKNRRVVVTLCNYNPKKDKVEYVW
jgi:hypothetical protein